ncbi:MAG TPA: sigma-54 dependent transcriptional regulator [Edaphobacter sp.]|nr:sigma-54 dependent transcriptional regulator [Edaphobacter sp.]
MAGVLGWDEETEAGMLLGLTPVGGTATKEEKKNLAAAHMEWLHVMVVDDDEKVRKACCEIAAQMGCPVVGAGNALAAQAILKDHPIDLILLDLKLPGGGGMSLLEHVKTLHPETAVVVMTAFATVSSAVEAMRIGASDYLTKPFTLEDLTRVLERAAQQHHMDVQSRELRERLRTEQGSGGLVGQSPEMEKLYRILSKVAFSSHPVLILGESGTGKDLVANLIHRNGTYADKPFLKLDCESLTPAQIECELFGHGKGSAADRERAKDGLLVSAGTGTVFLDEIGELPLDLQSKLLRALQEKEVRPAGTAQAKPIGARILAATKRDLAAMVEQGQFRKDLYFRLNVVNLRIPPLRNRREDIAPLAMYFLSRIQKDSGVERTFSAETLRIMTEYDWPGNVRELEHAVERACALSSGPVLHMGDMPTQLQDFRLQRMYAGADAEEAQAKAEVEASNNIIPLAEIEKQTILKAIEQLHGDKLLAAQLLGIGKTTLYRKLKEYETSAS